MATPPPEASAILSSVLGAGCFDIQDAEANVAYLCATAANLKRVPEPVWGPSLVISP